MKVINRLFKNKYFLITMQVITLCAFFLIILGGIGVTTDNAKFAKILRNTNLSNLIIWSYWWPLIIATSILFGKYWCSICPVELVQFFVEKVGLKKKPGKLLKSGFFVTIFYILILIIGIHTLAIHRIPNLMAFYMIFLLFVAVIVSIIWEKRTFCSYVCPIGHLLGLYSMFSSTELRVKDRKVCDSCNTKDCIARENFNKLVARSCTSNLYPANIDNNYSCILCSQCMKSCTKDNIIVKKRMFGKDLFKNVNLPLSAMIFFTVVSFFVIYEVLTEWSIAKHYVMVFPNYINNLFNVTGKATGTVKAISLFILLPLCFYGFFVFFKKTFGKESFSDSLLQLVLALLPVTATMHLLKAILKTTSRIPYWKFALKDMSGVKYAKLIMENPNLLNKEVLHTISPILTFFTIVLPFIGTVLGFIVVSKQSFKSSLSKYVSYFAVLLYGGLFMVTLTMWKLM